VEGKGQVVSREVRFCKPETCSVRDRKRPVLYIPDRTTG
jgi:hypothetical protein